MKVEKKLAWKNQKCHECRKRIFKNKVYFLIPEDASPFKVWKLCEECFNKIFKLKGG